MDRLKYLQAAAIHPSLHSIHRQLGPIPAATEQEAPWTRRRSVARQFQVIYSHILWPLRVKNMTGLMSHPTQDENLMNCISCSVHVRAFRSPTQTFSLSHATCS